MNNDVIDICMCSAGRPAQGFAIISIVGNSSKELHIKITLSLFGVYRGTVFMPMSHHSNCPSQSWTHMHCGNWRTVRELKEL